MTIPDLLRDSSHRYGHQYFIIEAKTGTPWTYERFNRYVNKAAHLLAAAGISVGDRAAIYLHNSIGFLITYFALMKLGATIVPLNPRLHVEDVMFVLRETGAKGLITSSGYWRRIASEWRKSPAGGVFFVEKGSAFWTQLEGFPDQEPEAAVQDDDPAAIIFKFAFLEGPCGVTLSHANLLAASRLLVEFKVMLPGDRLICVTPLFHAVGPVTNILAPLYLGNTVVLPCRFDPHTFWSLADKYQVTWFSTTPFNLIQLLTRGPERVEVPSLRFCLCGGAPLPADLQWQFEERFGVPVVEGYAMVETSGFCSFSSLPGTGRFAVTTGEGGSERHPGSAGIPAGHQIKVCDPEGREVPPGSTGHILVRGPAVTKGYFQQPELNSTVFRDGWFWTRDLGYKDDQGYLFVLGREQEVIVKGGEAIFPQEIDAVLFKHPLIKEAAVIGIPDPLYGEEIKAYVVPAHEGISAAEIVDFCKSLLPEFKCPRVVTFVKRIPRDPLGKPIRKELIRLHLNGVA